MQHTLHKHINSKLEQVSILHLTVCDSSLSSLNREHEFYHLLMQIFPTADKIYHHSVLLYCFIVAKVAKRKIMLIKIGYHVSNILQFYRLVNLV